MSRIFITGSSGYVASNLIPKLIAAGHEVSGIDLFDADYGPGYWHKTGDVRNIPQIHELMIGHDAVIHLAAISNDPSFDMNPEIGKSINYDCMQPIIQSAKDAGIKRFIFASTSSVYGVREEKDVIETTPLTPLTDYSKYKSLCEEILHNERSDDFETVVIRPATVCGWSSSIRLDLCVHILTMAALRHGVIKVFGGEQYRPNIHIEDLTDMYAMMLTAPAALVSGETFNVGHTNMTIRETAETIKGLLLERYDTKVEIETTPTNDHRSYHVSSEKIGRVLGFKPKHSIESAIDSLIGAYKNGLISEPDADRYYAIKKLKGIL